MALTVSGRECELREIVLRDKPVEFLNTSPSATVPALVTVDGTVLDESLDIMLWALERNDPESWLAPDTGDVNEMLLLIEKMDGSFKSNLDKYKYANRHTLADTVAFAMEHRDAAMQDIAALESMLQNHPYLFGDRLSLADIAIAPFVRQFANVDADWFAAQPCPLVQKWLANFTSGELFLSVMDKYPQWRSGTPGLNFPDRKAA